MPFKMVQNLSSNTSPKRSRTFRRIEKEMGSTLWGQSGCSSAQLFLPEGEARRPKYYENDSFCGSSGLLGIRSAINLRRETVQNSQPVFQTSEVQMHFCQTANKQVFWAQYLSTSLKLYILMSQPIAWAIKNVTQSTVCSYF